MYLFQDLGIFQPYRFLNLNRAIRLLLKDFKLCGVLVQQAYNNEAIWLVDQSEESEIFLNEVDWIHNWQIRKEIEWSYRILVAFLSLKVTSGSFPVMIISFHAHCLMTCYLERYFSVSFRFEIVFHSTVFRHTSSSGGYYWLPWGLRDAIATLKNQFS